MIRVLFVDDEHRVLTGIENALLFADVELEADFAHSGEEAIGRLGVDAYDVVVTDMKMPGLTGADVLEHAKAHAPDVIRIVLSGEVEPELAERAMPLTHEFVSKPCSPDQLFEIIERVHKATVDLDAAGVRHIVASLDRLPAQPQLHLQLQEAIGGGADAARLAALIETDLAIAAAIVRTANFAFYGFRTRAENVRDAVVRLGSETVGGIVLANEVARWASPDVEHLARRLNSHSARVADLTRRLLGRQIPQAALAGLLHDIGELVLLSQFTTDYQDLLEGTTDGGDRLAAERETFGTSHAEVGASLLDLWNANPLVTEVARHHHDESLDGLTPEGRALTEAVNAAQLALDPGGESLVCAPELVARAQELLAETELSAGSRS